MGVTMSRKMIDVVINIDSLIVSEDQTIEDVVQSIQNQFEMGYEPTWEVLYEEIIDD